MQDKELFDLCKQVYEATGWGLVLGMLHFDADGIKTMRSYRDGIAFTKGCTPLYTSDYLLEKLPPALWVYSSKEGRKLVHLLNIARQGDGNSVALYEIPYDEEFRGAYQSRSETTLKALLKLTLALHEAGELKLESVNNE